MKTGFGKLDAARDGTSAAASVEFSTYPNAMSATQEAAPYLGRALPAVTADQAEVANLMVKNGCHMGVAEITRVWNETAFYIKDAMQAGDTLAFDLGFVKFFPAIEGTFPSADAPFDPKVNRLYVAAQPSDDIRTALEKGTPTRADADAGAKPRIIKVTWGDMKQSNVIKGDERFAVIGTALTLGSGDEHADLKLPGDGGTVEVALEAQTSADDGSQRVFGRLTQPVDACEGAVLTLWTHGLSPDSALTPATSNKLTVLAGDAPGPTPIAQTSDGKCKVMTFEDGEATVTFGVDWNMTGSGLFGSNAPSGEWSFDSAWVHVGAEDAYFQGMWNDEGTEATMSPRQGESLTPGMYDNVLFHYTVVRDDITETLDIPIAHMVVA